jgi:hypothetical protein
MAARRRMKSFRQMKLRRKPRIKPEKPVRSKDYVVICSADFDASGIKPIGKRALKLDILAIPYPLNSHSHIIGAFKKLYP